MLTKYAYLEQSSHVHALVMMAAALNWRSCMHASAALLNSFRLAIGTRMIGLTRKSFRLVDQPE